MQPQGKSKSVTVQEFLSSLFEGREPYVVGRAPGAKGGWVGWRYRKGPMDQPVHETWDQYFLVCTIVDPKLGHKRENLGEAVCFYLDDVKHRATEIAQVLGQPSYIVETSRGNYSWYYKLEPGEKRLDLFEACVAAAKAKGFTDTGGTLASKWMRLPGGANNKHTPPWKVRGRSYLIKGKTHSLDDLAARLGVDPSDATSWMTSGAMLPGVAENLREYEDDRIWQGLEEKGWVLGQRAGSKWLDIECPWAAEHTSPDTGSGTGYLPSLDGGVFHCMHEHCAGRGVRDLEDWMEAAGLISSKPGVGNEFGVVADGGADELVDSYVYVTSARKYLEKRTGLLLMPEVINDLWAHRFPGGKGSMPPTKRFQRTCDPDLDVADTTTYQYGGPEMFSRGRRTLYNVWDRYRGPTSGTVVQEYEIRTWLELVQRVIPDGTLRELFLDWCGFLVVEKDKPNWQWVLTSLHQGIGKDTMLEPLKCCLGDENYAILQADTIGARFNDYLETRLVVVNEMQTDPKAGKQLYNLCKTYWAAPPDWVSVEKKNRDRYDVWNGTGWILTSNHQAPVALDVGDRRISMIHSEAEPLSQVDARGIWDWLDKDGGRERAAVWIRQRGEGLSTAQKDRFKDRAPDSSAKRTAQILSMHPQQAWIFDSLQEVGGSDWPDVWDTGSILDEMQKAIVVHELEGPLPKSQQVARWVRELGGKSLGQIRVDAGGRKSIVALRNVSRYENLTNSQIRESYNKLEEENVLYDVF